jgi:hypothetical protein
MPRDNKDRCPNCEIGFSILRVRFSLTGTRLLSVCPNCALIQADDTTLTWPLFVRRESAPTIAAPSGRPKFTTRKTLAALGVRRFSDHNKSS